MNIGRADGVQTLSNMLTSGTSQLNCAMLGIQEEVDAVFSLAVSGGIAYVRCSGRRVSTASVLFHKSVYLADEAVLCVNCR